MEDLKKKKEDPQGHWWGGGTGIPSCEPLIDPNVHWGCGVAVTWFPVGMGWGQGSHRDRVGGDDDRKTSTVLLSQQPHSPTPCCQKGQQSLHRLMKDYSRVCWEREETAKGSMVGDEDPLCFSAPTFIGPTG